VHVGGEELRGSHLLVAVGRRANTDDLGCDAAGIVLDRGGYVSVDDRYRTTAPGVFAVGDVRCGNIKRVASAVGEGSIAIAFVHQVLRQ